MDNFSEKLNNQIVYAIEAQQILLKRINSGHIVDNADKTAMDILSQIIKNAITVDKYSIDKIDVETYDKCLKNFTDKDTKLY